MSAHHSKGETGRTTEKEEPKGTGIYSEVALSLSKSSKVIEQFRLRA